MTDISFLSNELNDYLNSHEMARIYNYDNEGNHINSQQLKCKIIKESCSSVKKWLTTDSEIKAKNISLFVEGRRSIVPFHYMYKSKYKSSVFNEDCIFNEKYFSKTIANFRTNKSYSCAFVIMKPGAIMKVPNAYCQPYVICELFLLDGSGNLKTDYYKSEINNQKNVHRFYYRSNIILRNSSPSNSIFFINCNFMFNKFNVSDFWESSYESL